MASVFAGQNCATVADQLGCFATGYTCMSPQPNSDFDPASTHICQPMIIYLGVRFV